MFLPFPNNAGIAEKLQLLNVELRPQCSIVELRPQCSIVHSAFSVSECLRPATTYESTVKGYTLTRSGLSAGRGVLPQVTA
jgi:hypothetical protein